MTDQSIFDDDNASPEPASSGSTDQVPAADQLLSGIVNAEGKQKYASVEEALKGLNAAQDHISRLEQENTEFKQKVEKSTTLQDVLEAMKPKEEGEPAPAAAPDLDEGKLAELLEKVVERKEAVTTQKTNATTVANKFRELYGEEAKAKYYEAAANVGMGRSDIDMLAASNPDAVFAMLGVATKQEVPKSGVKSSLTTSEFQEKPKEMPKFDPMKPAKNSALEKWQASAKITNERLGVE